MTTTDAGVASRTLFPERGGAAMADKICPNCLQEWPQCVCVTPIRRGKGLGGTARPMPHPVLSQQIMGPLQNPSAYFGAPVVRPIAGDPPKEFCPDCHRPWQSCVCEGRRL